MQVFALIIHVNAFVPFLPILGFLLNRSGVPPTDELALSVESTEIVRESGWIS